MVSTIFACYEVVPQTGHSQYLTRLLFPMWHLSFIVFGPVISTIQRLNCRHPFRCAPSYFVNKSSHGFVSEAKSWCFDRPEGKRSPWWRFSMRSNMAHPTAGKFHARFFHVKGLLRPTRAWSLCKAFTKLETTVPLNKPHEMVYTVKILDGNNVVLHNLP